METARKILELAESRSGETSRILSDIVKIPSLSGGEKDVVAALKAECEKAGFDEVRVDGLGNLVARVGSGPRILAIDAHIDTVDTGDPAQWDLPPYSGLVRDGFVHGRGTVDQKGGAAAMVAGGRILKELGACGDFSVYFTFTVMEEDCDGLCWKYLIEEEKLVPEYAVITEPTNLGVYRGHRGRMEIEMCYSGVSCHGSAPERGVNAAYKAAEGLLAIRSLHERLAFDEFLGKGSVTATLVESSSPSLCAVPDRCRVHLDRRLTWGEALESAVAEVRQAIGNEARVEVPVYDTPSYKGTVFTQEKYFPTWKIAADHPLAQAGVRAARVVLGQEPVLDKWTFSTNAVAICGRHGIPCIGFGPGNEVLAHAPNEKTPVDHLVKASAFYALLPTLL